MSPVYFLADTYYGNPFENENAKHDIPKFYHQHINIEPAIHYWICKTHGMDNIYLTDNVDSIPINSYVVCSFSKRHDLQHRSDLKLMQIVTDDPEITGCVAYLTYDPSLVRSSAEPKSIEYWGLHRPKKNNWYHIRFYNPIGLKPSKPQWPPVNYWYNGHGKFPDGFNTDEFAKQMAYHDINIIYTYDRYYNTGDEHVMWGFRPAIGNWNHYIEDNVEVYHRNGAKSPNKLYMAWAMNIPGIFDNNPSMQHISTDPHMCLFANTVKELKNQMIMLKIYEDTYWNMVDQAKLHQYDNDNTAVYQSWVDTFTSIQL